MGFTVEDKRLIKCLRVSSDNEYLILTSMECLTTLKHTLKILCKSKHFPPRYKRKREWLFLLSEHQTKTPTRVFFYPVRKWILCIFEVRKKPPVTPFSIFERWQGPQRSWGPGKKSSLLSYRPIDVPGVSMYASLWEK